MSTSSSSSHSGTVNDIFLWRRKKLSLAVLMSSTLTWLLLEIFDYKLVSLAAQIAFLTVASVFLYSNMAALLGKEVVIPNIEISDKSALETAHLIRQGIEEPVRWVLQRIVVQRDWRVFVESIVALSVGSVLGTWFDLLTLLYIGVLVGFTIPVFCVKYEQRIKECWDRLRSVAGSWYQKIDEKFLRKIKNKVRKEKKTE